MKPRSFLEKFRLWLRTIPEDSPYFKAIRSELGRRNNSKRKTRPPGPGRPRGTKNKPGHKAGRPRLKK